MKRMMNVFLIALFFGAIVSCGQENSAEPIENPPVETVASVKSISPESGAIEVADTTVVKIVFTDVVQLTDTDISVSYGYGSQKVNVSYDFSGSDSVWQIMPYPSWPEGKMINIRLGRGIGLLRDYDFGFSTHLKDTTSFRVLFVNPPHGTEIDANTAVKVTFSEAVDPISANQWTSFNGLPGTVSGKEVFFSNETLPEGQTVKLVISAKLASQTGNTLADGDIEYSYQVKVDRSWSVGTGWKFVSGATDNMGAIYGGGGYAEAGVMDSSFIVKFVDDGKIDWVKKKKYGNSSYTNLVAAGPRFVYRTVLVDEIVGTANSVKLQVLDGLNGEILNTWDLGSGRSLALAVIDDKAVVSFTHVNTGYVKLFSPVGQEKSINLSDITNEIYITSFWVDGDYIYAGGSRTSGRDTLKNGIQIFKFDESLNQHWYKHYHPLSHKSKVTAGGCLTVVRDTLVALGISGLLTPQVTGVMYKLDRSGGLIQEIHLDKDINFINKVTTDGTFIYKIKNYTWIDMDGQFDTYKKIPEATDIFYDQQRGWIFIMEDFRRPGSHKLTAFSTSGLQQN